MYVYGGTVRAAAEEMSASATAFVGACARRFEQIHEEPAGDAERRSWHASWPPMLDALVDAGLGELWLCLEYTLTGSSERVDALLLDTADDGQLAVVVVELKQWDRCKNMGGSQVRIRGEVRPHPAAQAAGYIAYLQQWVRRTELKFDVRGTAILHNAPPGEIERLRASSPVPEVSLLGRDDLAATSALAARLGLAAPAPDAVEEFLTAPHAAPVSLFEDLENTIDGGSSFTLTGEQQHALLEVRSPELPVLVEDSGLQECLHQSQHASVSDSTSHLVHQGRVVDRVEARLDVALDHPLVGVLGQEPCLGDRVLCLVSGAEPVGAWVKVHLENRLQHQLQGRLDHPVGRGRDSQTTHLSVRLGNHSASSATPSTRSALHSTARRSPRRPAPTATNRHLVPPSYADVAVNYCRQDPLKAHQELLYGPSVLHF